ncbi:MAG: hypothetical protein ACLU3I_07200 [Acutalibacteraceae bacterium]
MEKKLDLEDTVRAVTEQPWARIRAFMKPVIPALAAVLIAALAAGCTMMDSVPQETPASEVEPPEAAHRGAGRRRGTSGRTAEDARGASGRIGSFGQRASRVLRLSAGQF